MAKIRTGAVVGQISGSIAGVTFGHNRGGAYIRNRGIPDKFTSIPALNAKDRLARMSEAWAGLLDSQRSAWTEYARQHPVVDSLGEKRPLTGHQMYVSCSARLDLVGVTSIPATPPATVTPLPLLTLSLVYDIGSGGVALSFDVSPTVAPNSIYVTGSLVNSVGINYVKNVLKYIQHYDAVQTSPIDISTDFQNVYGTPSVGQKVTIFAHVLDKTTGLISTSLRADAVVINTP